MRLRSVLRITALVLVLLKKPLSRATYEDPSGSVHVNDRKIGIALIDVWIPSSDTHEREIVGLLEDFFAEVRKQMPMKYDFRICVLITFPKKDADDGQHYGFLLNSTTDNETMKRDRDNIKAMMHRNATESENISARSESNLHLFAPWCRRHGAPALPVFLRKVPQTTGQSWNDSVEQELVPRFAENNETIGLLIATSHFGTPANQSKSGVFVVMYNLSNTSDRFWSMEGDSFGQVAVRLVEKIDTTLKDWLTLCDYTMTVDGCYYRRHGHCKARVLRRGTLPNGHPHKAYCVQGREYRESQRHCPGYAKCDITCAKYENWSACNATCGDGYKRQVLEPPPEESAKLKYCPAKIAPMLEECSVDCPVASGAATDVPVPLIIGFILLVVPFAGCLVVFWFLWREERAPAVPRKASPAAVGLESAIKNRGLRMCR